MKALKVAADGDGSTQSPLQVLPLSKTSICQVFLCEIVSFQINRLIIKTYSNTQYFYFMHSYMTQEKSFFIQARQPEAKPRV